jgi:hypothetical protein
VGIVSVRKEVGYLCNFSERDKEREIVVAMADSGVSRNLERLVQEKAEKDEIVKENGEVVTDGTMAMNLEPPTNPMVTSLLTDMYQITMAYAYWKAGKQNDRAVYDLSLSLSLSLYLATPISFFLSFFFSFFLFCANCKLAAASNTQLEVFCVFLNDFLLTTLILCTHLVWGLVFP